MLNAPFMNGHKPALTPEDDLAWAMKKVRDKTPDQLAESIEIMIMESRPDQTTREALRAACCYLRGEPTSVGRPFALHALAGLKAKCDREKRPPRSFIISRAISILQAGGPN